MPDELDRQAPADASGTTGRGQTGAGRRPGESGTRDAILTAARRQFADLGYDRASLRGIARAAGVDPGLVAHFFGSKQRLFVTVVELPFVPAEVLPRILAGDPAAVGGRLAAFIVGALSQEESRSRLIGLIRSAAAEPEAASMVRDLITRDVLVPLVERIGSPDAPLRASLIGAQVVGLVMARYIVAVEPIASVGADTLTRVYAPIFQRLLVEPLMPMDGRHVD